MQRTNFPLGINKSVYLIRLSLDSNADQYDNHHNVCDHIAW